MYVCLFTLDLLSAPAVTCISCPLHVANFVLDFVLQSSSDLEKPKGTVQADKSADPEVIRSSPGPIEQILCLWFLRQTNPRLLEQCPRKCVVFFAEAPR